MIKSPHQTISNHEKNLVSITENPLVNSQKAMDKMPFLVDLSSKNGDFPWVFVNVDPWYLSEGFHQPGEVFRFSSAPAVADGLGGPASMAWSFDGIFPWDFLMGFLMGFSIHWWIFVPEIISYHPFMDGIFHDKPSSFWGVPRWKAALIDSCHVESDLMWSLAAVSWCSCTKSISKISWAFQEAELALEFQLTRYGWLSETTM